MIKTVLFIVHNRFTKRDFTRFGLQYFRNLGFNVEVLDVSGILRSKLYVENYFPDDQIEESFIYDCPTKIQLKYRLSKYESRSTFAVLFFFLYASTSSVYKLISEFEIKYATIQLGALPLPQSKLRFVLTRFKYWGWLKLFTNSINPTTVHIIAGQKSLQETGKKINKRSVLLECASNDYNDFYSRTNVIESNETSNKIVFIDEFYPFHPDMEGQFLIDPDFYFNRVNSFLHELEQITQLKCVVALHPRSVYKKIPYEFPVFKGETQKLIRHSDLVVGHASTAFSFAILAGKPILQIGFWSIRNHYYGITLRNFARELGRNPLYLDKKYSIQDWKANTQNYDTFIRNYMSVDNLKKPTYFFEVLATYLKRMA